MSIEVFTQYVNEELPKRLSTEQPSTALEAGRVPVSTGVGLQVAFLNLKDHPELIGKSAYEVAVAGGYVGTETDWLLTLKGPQGEEGPSAYETALALNPDVGTEAEWLESLKGKTAYQVAYELDAGVGTVEAWLLSLKGKDGKDGVNGTKGVKGDVGTPGFPLNIKGTVTEAEFTDSVMVIDTWAFGDCWFVAGAFETMLWVFSESDPESELPYQWIPSGNMRGPEGTGLVVRGEWNLAELPTLGNVKGDTWGFNNALWTWMLAAGWEDLPENYKYVQIVPEGPQGKDGIQGLPGVKGETGDKGLKGDTGTAGTNGTNGTNGTDGESAYQIALALNPLIGSEAEWLESLKGKTAYQVAYELDAGVGTVEAWLLSLKGKDGTDGKSAYQVAFEQDGSIGNEATWLNSLIGPGVKINGGYATKVELDAAVATAAVNFAYSVSDENTLYYLKEDRTLVSLGVFKGERGLKGDVGEKGEKGDAGNNALPFTILDTLALAADLPDISLANPAEAYLVPNPIVPEHLDLYVFQPTANAWVNLGTHQGPQGLKGEKGEQGIKGDTGTAGTNGTNGTNGTDGESAYQVALALNPLIGSEAEWLLTLKGETGDGGKNLVVSGIKSNYAEIELIFTPAEQEAWMAADTLHLWMYIEGVWVDLGTHQGPQGIQGEIGLTGQSAYEMAKDINGFTGTASEYLSSLKGDKGDVGEKGDIGEGFKIHGTVLTVEALPAATALNRYEVWVVEGQTYHANITGTSWSVLGPVAQQGETGVKGNTVRISGEVTTVATLPLLTEVSDGEGYIVTEGASGEVIKHLYVANKDTDTYDGPFNIEGPQGPDGPQGAIGPTGEVGQGIVVMGDFLTEEALRLEHPTSTLGYAFTVGAPGSKEMFVWTTNTETQVVEYQNLGSVSVGPQGPKGDRGIQGVPGIRGMQGFKGDKGSRWVILPPEYNIPENNIGVADDWCIDRTGVVWYKDVTGWKSFVHLMDVPVAEVPSIEGSKKMLRHNGGWTELLVDENPTAAIGVQYVRVGTAEGKTVWAELQLPKDLVHEAVGTDTYARSGETWVKAAPTTTGLTANTSFVLRDGTWQQLDTYSLKTSTVSANVTINPVNQQCYTVNTSAARAITLADGPAGRSCVVVIVLTGGAVVPTFPGTKVKMNNSEALTLNAAKTVVTAFWDGSEWIVSKGVGY